MIARIILLMAFVLAPTLANAAPTKAAAAPTKAAPIKGAQAPTTMPTPVWDITKPSSCSVEGPPPCPKCSITCDAPHVPTCIPGSSQTNGTAVACVRQPACSCK